MGCNQSVSLESVEFKDVPEETYGFRRAKVLKVYDGDTYWVAAYHKDELLRFRVRLYGVDCDELKGNRLKALEAKRYVTDLLLNKVVNIHVIHNTVYDGKLQSDKYGRLLCVIYVNGADLSQLLIQGGFARPYFGGNKNHMDF